MLALLEIILYCICFIHIALMNKRWILAKRLKIEMEMKMWKMFSILHKIVTTFE